MAVMWWMPFSCMSVSSSAPGDDCVCNYITGCVRGPSAPGFNIAQVPGLEVAPCERSRGATKETTMYTPEARTGRTPGRLTRIVAAVAVALMGLAGVAAAAPKDEQGPEQ